jgi:hypothetical protein
MPRVSFKYGLTNDDKAIAEQNGIAISTVYARLRSGWDKQRAITEKPQKVPFSGMERDENGEIIGENPKGKPRAFALPRDLDSLLDSAIADSGKSQSEFVSDLLIAAISPTKKPSQVAGKKG